MMSKVQPCSLPAKSSRPTTIWLGMQSRAQWHDCACATGYDASCRRRIAPIPVQSTFADVVRPFGPLPFRPFRSSPFIGPLPRCPLGCCWCVLPVRLVFLCVPHAQACRKLRGTRDTTPDLCSSLCCVPRLHPYWRRCRASCWGRSIELSCFTRRPAGRDRVAVVQRARGERAMAGIALRDQKEMVQRGPSRTRHDLRQRT